MCRSYLDPFYAMVQAEELAMVKFAHSMGFTKRQLNPTVLEIQVTHTVHVMQKLRGPEAGNQILRP